MDAEDLWRVPAKNGWQKSPVSPMEVLRLFGRLKVREGFELIAYVFRDGLQGKGVVWAVPEGHFPEVGECAKLDEVGTPKPEKALLPSMVLDGDGTPESYIQASIFLREMDEFGALWHELRWGLHEIIDELPAGFHLPEMVDIRPRTVFEKNTVTEFFTLELLEKMIYRHSDTFDGYSLKNRIDEKHGIEK
ncbi:hypothetical protein [Geoglobus acetivorans]|uniref:Uncharacterized protein n=1 Tax=Geoglobus acetivorans TaxID=565033 RepID=A0A0A7GBC9_GEOAI|nr:hypothetical protein GACE_0242 [Geoglobus acetivorans]